MKITLVVSWMIMLIGCSPAKKNGLLQSAEKNKLASFILVKSIPVSIFSADSLMGFALQRFITDTLKASGYKFMEEEERTILQKKFFFDVFGSNDPAKIKEIGDKVKADKDYIVKQKGAGLPIEQVIILLTGEPDENTIKVRRVNIPTSSKNREWLIRFEDSEKLTNIAFRIVDSVTVR